MLIILLLALSVLYGMSSHDLRWDDLRCEHHLVSYPHVYAVGTFFKLKTEIFGGYANDLSR